MVNAININNTETGKQPEDPELPFVDLLSLYSFSHFLQQKCFPIGMVKRPNVFPHQEHSVE